MLTKTQAAAFKLTLFFSIATAIVTESAQAVTHFHLEKDSQGLFRPFQALSVPLPDFVREYSRTTGTPVATDGAWEEALKGNVTLLVRQSLKSEEMTELLYRVLNDNDYAVVDSPAGNGWIIERLRDARDAALPVYEASEVPETNRLITVHQTLQFADADSIARTMRSFMPNYSRIISIGHSQILITDTGVNIRKLYSVISQMDTAEAAKRASTALAAYPPQSQQSCGEQKIEKLVVEKLEIQDSGNSNNATHPGNGPNNGPNSQIKRVLGRTEGVTK